MLAGLVDEPVAVENYVEVLNFSVNIYPVGIGQFHSVGRTFRTLLGSSTALYMALE